MPAQRTADEPYVLPEPPPNLDLHSADAEPVVAPDADSDIAPATEPVAEAEPTAEAEPDAAAEAEPDAAEAEPDTEAESDAAAEAELDTDAAEPEPPTGPAAEAGPGDEPDPGDAKTETEAAAPDTGPDSDASPESAGPNSEAGPEDGDVLASGSAVRSHRLRRAGQAARGWSRRPAGRVALPAALIVVMLALTGATGAYLVPEWGPTTAANAGQSTAPSAEPSTGQDEPPPVDASGEPTPPPDSAQSSGQTPGVRPGNALAVWAAPIAAKVNIPLVAMQAYGYAELSVSQSQPTCQLRWTTLAGIGKVESDHGQAHATLGADGRALPAIIGPPLDGQGGRQAVTDTDQGQLDHDTMWDRAVGPMQFLPSTWKGFAVDADGDGTADPNDIYDASLAAARYLCSGGRNLSTAADWWKAILAYNAVGSYAQDVFNAANDYGLRSRS